VPIRSAPESAVKELPTDRTLVAMSDIAAGESAKSAGSLGDLLSKAVK
jgi:hypothetical protein